MAVALINKPFYNLLNLICYNAKHLNNIVDSLRIRFVSDVRSNGYAQYGRELFKKESLAVLLSSVSSGIAKKYKKESCSKVAQEHNLKQI